MPRWLIAVLVAALVAIAAGTLGLRYLSPAGQQRLASAQPGAPVRIGGPFTLTDQAGRRVTDQDFRGRFMLVYFGYTFCPDVCPLGLQTLSQALDEVPAELQDRVVPVFVTVDPARDTPAVMRDYVAAFHPRLVALTGSEPEIAQTIKAYRVFARKAEAPGGDSGAYLVDHSTFTYLIGPDGAYRTHFGHDVTPEEMARRLTEAIRAG